MPSQYPIPQCYGEFNRCQTLVSLTANSAGESYGVPTNVRHYASNLCMELAELNADAHQPDELTVSSDTCVLATLMQAGNQQEGGKHHA